MQGNCFAEKKTIVNKLNRNMIYNFCRFLCIFNVQQKCSFQNFQFSPEFKRHFYEKSHESCKEKAWLANIDICQYIQPFGIGKISRS